MIDPRAGRDEVHGRFFGGSRCGLPGGPGPRPSGGQLAQDGVAVLVVRAGMRLAGTVAAREIIAVLARCGAVELDTVAIEACMTPNPATIDAAAGYAQGLERIAHSNAPFLILTSGERIAGVASSRKLAIAICRLLQTELNTMNHYLADLHEAGLD